MLQIAQNYRTGALSVVEVASPAIRPGGVVVRSHASLISTGTERAKVELSRNNLLEKARERPEAVRQVIDVVRKEGVDAAYRRVMNKLDRLTPLGYSAAGVITAVATDVSEFRVGDRVAVAGGGYANHAEELWVPRNLLARIPDNVEFDQAAFATVGSVALHGLRLAQIQIGESVAIIGLGLIGQIAAQLARAAGCRVIGCDMSAHRCRLLRDIGVVAASPDAFAELVRQQTQSIGTDAVVLTASGKSDEPLLLAATVARDRARIVAVGATGLSVPRDEFYQKELSLVVSRSYGPGRYDADYEEKGRDYPVGYVRWTEGRNLKAVLDSIATGAVDFRRLISRRVEIANAPDVYDELVQGAEELLGVLLEYPERPRPAALAREPGRKDPRSAPGVGFVGCGTFASNVLIPALRKAQPMRLRAVATSSGLTALDASRRHGFERHGTDADEVLDAPDVDLVVIATTHASHAQLAQRAAAVGRAVFVEKPLAISRPQLSDLQASLSPDARVMVGFNRRFSPHVLAVQKRLAGRTGAVMVSIRVNAGPIPANSWVHDPEIGGGRLIGEGCHFIDLAIALAGTPPSGVRCTGIGASDVDAVRDDNFSATLDFPDGSVATVTYTAKGDSGLGKERIEVFCDSWCAVIDDFNVTTIYSGRRVETFKRRGAKGHEEEVAAVMAALRSGGGMPVPLEDLFRSTEATLAAKDSISRRGERIELGDE